MLLLREGKVYEVLENGLMLAAFDFAAYTTAAQKLQPGDRLLLYTDGIVEAASAGGEFFGQESLSALLRQTSGVAPRLRSIELFLPYNSGQGRRTMI
jgi:sigma-B regulation protein RsbU (phosphoserine phosphatase)